MPVSFLVCPGILVEATACSASNGSDALSSASPATLPPGAAIVTPPTGDQTAPTIIPPQRTPAAPAADSDDAQAAWQRGSRWCSRRHPVYQPMRLPGRFRQTSPEEGWYIGADEP